MRRTGGFTHVVDIMIGSFYDPALETGCAFEEPISFHGGIVGPQTRPFIFHPADLAVPGTPSVGAATVHKILLAGGASSTAPRQLGRTGDDGRRRSNVVPVAKSGHALQSPLQPKAWRLSLQAR